MGAKRAAAKQPWMKFFPSDWRSDVALRVCSLAARGLWCEMLCIMHDAEPRGYLVVGGQPVDDGELAKLVGAPMGETVRLVADLEKAGVFSRDGKGRIYSRRMVRDEKRAKTAKKNGGKGGNPRLRSATVSADKQTGNSASDNHQFKGEVNTHIPEARSQKPEKKKQEGDSSLRSPSPSDAGPDAEARAEAAAWCRSDETVGWCFACGRASEALIRSTVERWLETHDPRAVREAIEGAQCRGTVSNSLEYVNRVLQNRRATEGAGYLRVVNGGARQGDDDALRADAEACGMTVEEYRRI